MTPQQTDLLYLFNRFANQAKQYFEQDNSYKGGMYLGMVLEYLEELGERVDDKNLSNSNDTINNYTGSIYFYYTLISFKHKIRVPSYIEISIFNTYLKNLKDDNTTERFIFSKNTLPEVKQILNTRYQYQLPEETPASELLPIALRQLNIKNRLGLKNINTDLLAPSRFIVFTGNNGQGKTNILQAISIALLEGKDETLGLSLVDQPCDISCIVETKDELLAFRHRQLTEQNSQQYKPFHTDSWLKTHPDGQSTRNSLFAYGASRLQLQSEESQDANPNPSNIYGLFKNNHILLNIDYWLKMQKLRGKEERIQAVIQVLKQLLPSVEDIQLGPDETPEAVLDQVHEDPSPYFTDEFPIFYIEHGQKRRSSELSAGNKSILAMIGDLIIRLYRAQPKTIQPQDFYGIVLIDELEIHLHPSWQRELPRLLSSLFPKIQFIVTTHSPIVFLGMPPETVIFNLQFDENGQTILQRLNLDLANILPNQILTSELFGMDNIRNIHNQGIEQLSLETEQERQQRLKLEEEIRKKAQNYQFTPPKKD